MSKPKPCRTSLISARSFSYLEAITLTAESRHEESLEHHRSFLAWASTMAARMPLSIATSAACTIMQSRSLEALGRHAEASLCLVKMRAALRKHDAKEVEYLCDQMFARQSSRTDLTHPASADPLSA